MIGMTLAELVLSARKLQPWYDQALFDAIRARMKSHPEEINKKGLMNLAPVHLAVICEQPMILEILVLDGKADLDALDENNRTPDILTSSEKLKALIIQLQKESKRRAQSKGQHLHDLLRKRDCYTTAKDYENAIRTRVLQNPEEVNEKTFLGRNAIHWCAYYDQVHLMRMIKELCSNAEMNEKDDLGLSASELIPKKIAIHEGSDFSHRRAKRSSSFMLAEQLDKIEIKEIKASPKVANSRTFKDVSLIEVRPSEAQQSAASLSLSEQSDERQVRLLAHNPRRYYLAPFVKALHANRIAFLNLYLSDHFPLEEIAEINGSSALFYAFKTGGTSAFSMLLNMGEDITSKSAAGDDVTSWAFSQENTAIDTILVKAQNSLLEHIDWQKIKENDLELLDISRKFNETIGDQGLARILPHHAFAKISPAMLKSIADTNRLDFGLVKVLYQVCSCLNEDTYSIEFSEKQERYNARSFDVIEGSDVISGLIAAHNPQAILATLSKLQPHYDFSQRLITLFLIKEMLMRSDIFTRSDLNILATVQLSVLHSSDMEDTGLKRLLMKMISIAMTGSHQQVQSYYVLESLIQRRSQRKDQIDISDLLQLLPQHKTSERAKILAEELRAYALMLYQNLNLKEIASDLWRDQRRSQLTPSVYAFEEYINGLNVLLSREILKRKDIKDRVRFIKYLIKTIQVLLSSDVPDFNSAMALFSCLNSGPISRLEETFTKLDAKSKSALDSVKNQLEQRNNYKAMRGVMDENAFALPFFGLMTTDLTFSSENKAGLNRYVITGKVLKRIEKRRQHLFLFHLPIKSNVGRVLHSITLNGAKTEDQLYHDSYLLEQKPFKLVDNADITLLREHINVIKEGKLVLRMAYKGEIYTGERAVHQLENFLNEQFRGKKIKLDDLEALMQTAHQCVNPSSAYAVNRSYHGYMPSSATIAPMYQGQVERATQEELALKVLNTSSDGTKSVSVKDLRN